MTGRARQLVFTAAATADLVRLRAFIAGRDPTAAHRIAVELVGRIDLLRASPLMGKAVQSAPDPHAIRDMAFGNYVVRYAVTARSVAVLRVWHHFEQRD